MVVVGDDVPCAGFNSAHHDVVLMEVDAVVSVAHRDQTVDANPDVIALDQIGWQILERDQQDAVTRVARDEVAAGWIEASNLVGPAFDQDNCVFVAACCRAAGIGPDVIAHDEVAALSLQPDASAAELTATYV